MLAGVGCKDYDDDIDKVNGRIDQLETGKLASVEQQITAINSSITSLEAAYKAADAELKTALEKQASDLAAAKSALEASIKSLKDTHDADIKKLTSDLNALSTKVEGYNTALKAEIKKVADDLSANYYTKTVIDQKLAALDSKFAGEIAALDAKITACNEAIDAIKAQIETMKEQIAGKVNQSDYDAFTKATNEALAKNAEAVSVLQALCAGFPEGQTVKGYIDAAKADVVAMLDNYLLKETYEKFLETYGEFKTGIEGRMDAAEEEIGTLKAWMEEMTKNGGTLALLEQRLQEAIDAKTTLAEVKGTFNAECTEFLNGVNGIITSALAEDGLIGKELKSKLDALSTNLQGQIDALNERLSVLEGQISDLAGRIQSLVYVPKNINGIANFGGIVLTANDQTIRLTTGAKSQMTFLVSPKTLATKLAAQHNATKNVFSFIPEKVTRAEAPKFEIEGDVVGSEDGKITMFVSTDYIYPSDAVPSADAETYAIALKVASNSSATNDEESSVDTGIEYTTAYIPTVGDDDNVIDNIVLAKEEGEEKKFVEFPAAGAEYEMIYNQKEPLTMFDGYFFAYKMGKTIISLQKAAEQGKWDVELDATPVYTREKWTISPNMTKVTFDPADPMKNAEAKGKLVEITIEEGVPANVGKTIEDQVKAAIHAVDGTTNIATNNGDVYTATTTLKPFQLPAIENLNAGATWNYSIYSTNGAYLIRNIVFDAAGANKLTKAQYDLFKTSVEADNAWTVTYGDEAGTVNKGIQIQSVNLPTINTDGDAKFFDYWIGGYKGGSGTLDIEKTIALGQAEEITLKGKITFTGLPTDLKYTLNMPEAKITSYGGKVLTVIAQENFAKEAVYELLPDDQTFFADADEFLAFMRQTSKAGEMENNEQKNATTQALEASVRYNGIAQGASSAVRDRLCVDFQRSYVDFDNAESYTFTAPEDACYKIADAVFSIAIEGSVTINKDQGFYLAKGTSLNAEGNVVVMGTADKSGNSFAVETITLTNAYNAKYPEDANPAKVGLTFSLAATTPSVTPVPAITNGTDVTLPETWTMNWNGCGLNSVDVIAEMTYEGLPVHSKTFKVILTNPIDIASWGTNFNTLATPITVKTAATVNVWEKVLAAKNYGSPKEMRPRDIFGNELVDVNGVTAFATGAYDFDVKFGEASYSSAVGTQDFARFKFDPATGEMTVAASDDLLGGKITAQIQVTFTYKYSLDATEQYAKKEYPMNITLTFDNKK